MLLTSIEQFRNVFTYNYTWCIDNKFYLTTLFSVVFLTKYLTIQEGIHQLYHLMTTRKQVSWGNCWTWWIMLLTSIEQLRIVFIYYYTWCIDNKFYLCNCLALGLMLHMKKKDSYLLCCNWQSRLLVHIYFEKTNIGWVLYWSMVTPIQICYKIVPCYQVYNNSWICTPIITLDVIKTCFIQVIVWHWCKHYIVEEEGSYTLCSNWKNSYFISYFSSSTNINIHQTM